MKDKQECFHWMIGKTSRPNIFSPAVRTKYWNFVFCKQFHTYQHLYGRPVTKPETTVQDGASTSVSTKPLMCLTQCQGNFQPRLQDIFKVTPQQKQTFLTAMSAQTKLDILNKTLGVYPAVSVAQNWQRQCKIFSGWLMVSVADIFKERLGYFPAGFVAKKNDILTRRWDNFQPCLCQQNPVFTTRRWDIFQTCLRQQNWIFPSGLWDFFQLCM